MRHPGTRQWSDFVRGVVGATARASLKRHLGNGCRRCARKVRALGVVQRVAHKDAPSAPPPAVVRSAHDILRIQKLLAAAERAPTRLGLSFDSLMTPALAGTRTDPGAARHLVYESSRFMVGLQLHPQEGPTLAIDGQVLDTREGPIEGVSVLLFESGRMVLQDRSNRQGDFRLRAGSERPGRLLFLMPEGELADLEVPAAEA